MTRCPDPVAAGWGDAHRLGVEWVPIVADPDLEPLADRVPDRDVLFFGTLRYPPNVNALERLACPRPDVQRTPPRTTALVAGAAPVPRVVELCRRHDWESRKLRLAAGSRSPGARVAVAPLSRTAGIQIKILDAAMLHLPQVVRSPALAGLDPDFPLPSFDDDPKFVAEIVRVLDDRSQATREADTTRRHVLGAYSVDHWSDWAAARTD